MATPMVEFTPEDAAGLRLALGMYVLADDQDHQHAGGGGYGPEPPQLPSWQAVRLALATLRDLARAGTDEEVRLESGNFH